MTDKTRPEDDASPGEAAEPPKSAISRAAGSVVDAAGEVVSHAGAVAGKVFTRSNASRLRHLNRVPILSLDDVHPEVVTASRRELGFMTIPVSEIRGTAVQGAPQRGADFTPLPALKGANWRQRWQRLRAAQDRLAILPPIDVLQTYDGYWVLDGHNRVAMALLNGQDDIDANVTHVHLPGTDDAGLVTGSLEGVLADSRDLRTAAAGRPAARRRKTENAE